MARPPLNKKKQEIMYINSGGDMKVSAPASLEEHSWPSATVRIWYKRVSEIFTIFWLALVLIGSLAVVLYAIRTPKDQNYQPLNCNVTLPPSYNVFFHEIVPSDMPLPLELYWDYVSALAWQYQNLKFHIIFLYDTEYSMIPDHMTRLRPVFQEEQSKKIRKLQEKLSNVHITVSSLSKFLLVSPLKFKWRYMLPTFRAFFVRVLSVWAHGGVGIDISAPDEIIHSVLNQHNLGFKDPDYADTIKNLSFESDDMLNLIFDVFRQYMNTSFPLPKRFTTPKSAQQLYNVQWPLLRSHRNKRSVESYSEVSFSLTSDSNSSRPVESTVSAVPNQNLSELSVPNKTARPQVKIVETIISEVGISLTSDSNSSRPVVTTKSSAPTQKPSELLMSDKTARPQVTTLKKIENEVDKNDGSNRVVLVDIALLAERVVPYSTMVDKGVLTKMVQPAERQRRTCFGTVPYLTVLSEGAVVAATSRQHPLLAKFLSSTFVPLNPVEMLRELYQSQCFGSNVQMDPYCKKILIA